MIKPATLPSSVKTVVMGRSMKGTRRVVDAAVEPLMPPIFLPQRAPCDHERVIVGAECFGVALALPFQAELSVPDRVTRLDDHARVALGWRSNRHSERHPLTRGGLGRIDFL